MRPGDARPEGPARGRQVEITGPLVLSERESHLVEMHSVYNVLNVAVLRIDAVGELAGDASAADGVRDELRAWHSALADRERALGELRRAPEIRRRLVSWMEGLRGRVDGERREELEAHVENVVSIFTVLEARVAELVSRSAGPEPWRRLSVDHLRANLERAFRAIERNAFGRWRVAFSPADRPPGAYLMQVELGSRDGETLTIPPVLEDVMRDLAANARKFTEPGGLIRVTLAEEPDGVVLEVADTGRGMPEEEIEEVVRFGRRGSDQDGRVQTGGGFGLTKALHVARTHGGRMWIRSAPGAGTTVTIRLPLPPA